MEQKSRQEERWRFVDIYIYHMQMRRDLSSNIYGFDWQRGRLGEHLNWPKLYQNLRQVEKGKRRLCSFHLLPPLFLGYNIVRISAEI